MKKAFVAILALFYLTISVGATVHLHYCMGKLVSWGLTDHESKNCGTCGMAKTGSNESNRFGRKNCCTDEHRQIKTSSDQKSWSAFAETSQASFAAALLTNTFCTSAALTCIALKQPPANGPPPGTDASLFILHRNFRL